MRGAAGTSDDHSDTAALRVLRVPKHFVRHAVRRNDALLTSDAEFVENLGSRTHRFTIAGAAHDDADERRGGLRHGGFVRARVTADLAPKDASVPDFLMGINYWPQRSAMYMWERFDLGEIREDFARIAEWKLRVVRFFLRWDTFQPEPDAMDPQALQRLDAFMQAIADAGLLAMPTLFCGHMSGVNWLPAWTLDAKTPAGRFRTISGGKERSTGIGDFYTDPGLLRAQSFQAQALGARLRDHPALFAWDLGNEFSNLREPATPQAAAAWSERLSTILDETAGVSVTGGIHGEDITRDRHIRPSSIAAPWAFATMHGYSVYSSFAHGRLDANVAPFLCAITQACTAKPVLFSEFGNPTCPPNTTTPIGEFACLTEAEMASYANGVLLGLLRQGAIGGFWWCYGDYAKALADQPPFDRAPHELTFGLVRADGTPKPVVDALAQFAREGHQTVEPPAPIVDEASYYAALPAGLDAIYERYCESAG
jgi:endo-1,4-beta-mannosidase